MTDLYCIHMHIPTDSQYVFISPQPASVVPVFQYQSLTRSTICRNKTCVRLFVEQHKVTGG